MKQNLSLPDSEPLYFEAAGFCGASQPKIFHGFFSRYGGVSTDIYASLNCGAGSDDELADVMQNKRIVAESAGCSPEKLLTLYQVHSADCVVVRAPWPHDERPEADAMVSDIRGVALGILTADCAPVLLHGEKADGSPVIGAAHAGWGGALKGVLGNCVDAMVKIGARRETICAAIGPCIGQVSYEVSEAFSEPFLQEDEANEKFFLSGQREGHLMFDLAGYCALKLAKAGVGRVFIKDLDTYFNEEDFYSYRRKTYRNEKDYGRQISVIMIK